MSRRNKIIILSSLAIIAVLLIFLITWLVTNPQLSDPTPTADPSEIIIPVVLPQSSSGDSNPDPIETVEENLETSLRTIAVKFSERFGSYSNEGNFTNLNDLRGLMTFKMQAWVDTYIESQNSNVDESYYGVTTIAVSSILVSLDEEFGQAEMLVSTQRQISKGTTVNPRVSYQNLELQLVKTGDGWKVDSAEWQ